MASVRCEFMQDVQEFLDSVSCVDECFETIGIYSLNRIIKESDSEILFMGSFFLPDMEKIEQFKKHCQYEIRVLPQEELQKYYKIEWSNALSGRNR